MKVAKKNARHPRHNQDIIELTESSTAKERLRKESNCRYKIYSELIQKRSNIHNEIKKSLLPKAMRFRFNNWWRLTTFKYTQNPLSAKGSRQSPIGGRFNIGKVEITDTGKFSSFPALYLAESKDVAMRERYPSTKTSLSSHELMLREPCQDVFVEVKGEAFIINIDSPKALTPFVKVIKTIKYDPSTKKDAERFNCPSNTVQTVKELKNALYLPNWREYVAIWDDPAPSQIFAQIVKSCGIEGVLYSSSQSRGKCIALFLENFKGSNSFVVLTNPPEGMQNIRIDRATFKDFF